MRFIQEKLEVQILTVNVHETLEIHSDMMLCIDDPTPIFCLARCIECIAALSYQEKSIQQSFFDGRIKARQQMSMTTEFRIVTDFRVT